MMPPAKALPTEPMDLDETVEEGTGDTEMVDADKNGARKVEAEVKDQIMDGEGEKEEGKATTEVKKASANGSKTTKGSSKSKADPKGKGKGKAIEKEGEMTNGQSAKEIEMGLEAMGEETYKGKSLTDPVKSVAVSFFALY